MSGLGVNVDLTVVWAGIIAFAVAMYVVMDGFDLGIGILFPGFKVGKERDMAMNAIAPVWDGNETWLILGGGGLMAAFPLAYAIVLPALYAPLIAMLLGLVFRGVAFEFRWRHLGHQRWWDLGFFGGSVVATFAQGIALGAMLQGIAVTGRAYGGGWWDWLTPFTVLTGASLIAGYALLGAGWLLWKTEGPLRNNARRYARRLVPVLVIAIALVSAATPFLEGRYYQRWFAWPGLLAAAPVPLLVAGVTLMLWRSIARGQDRAPFLLTLALFGLSMIGLAISIWPDVIPGRVSIWQAAAPERSQIFMLVGASVLVPVILAYTGWAYWVFRGKISEAGYH
jgi:cytochrome d ubiquinol oxidase subunit II